MDGISRRDLELSSSDLAGVACTINIDPVFEDEGIVYECAIWARDDSAGPGRPKGKCVRDSYRSTSFFWLVEIARINLGAPEPDELPARCFKPHADVLQAVIDVVDRDADETVFSATLWRYPPDAGEASQSTPHHRVERGEPVARAISGSLVDALAFVGSRAEQSLSNGSEEL